MTKYRGTSPDKFLLHIKGMEWRYNNNNNNNNRNNDLFVLLVDYMLGVNIL